MTDIYLIFIGNHGLPSHVKMIMGTIGYASFACPLYNNSNFTHCIEVMPSIHSSRVKKPMFLACSLYAKDNITICKKRTNSCSTFSTLR